MSAGVVPAGEKITLEALLGTGSVGEVWRARTSDGTVVALKRLLPHAARNPAAVAAFEREGRLHGRLQHVGVPKLVVAGRDASGPYLLLEYVDGVTLEQLMERPLPVSVALRIAHDVLDALDAVHALRDEQGRLMGLVHRDLAPSNVLISSRGQVKLADFGIARANRGTHATTGVMAKGTLGYMSPEQARGEPVDVRSDLFAVGALLHEMLCGAVPYDESDPRLALARARAGDVRPLAERLPEADPALADLVDRALAAARTERFATAADMQREVRSVAEGTVGLAAPPDLAALVVGVPRQETPIEAIEAAHPKRGARRAVAAGLLVVLALGAAGLFLARAGASTAPSAATTAPAAVSALPAHEPEPVPVSPLSSAAEVLVPAKSSPARSYPWPKATTSPATEMAILDIGSEPAFAYVFLDGRKIGSTPIFGLKLPAGAHQVRVEREGLGSRTSTIHLQPGEHAARVFRLP